MRTINYSYWQNLIIVVAALFLVSCNRGQRGPIDRSGYENAIGEAVVRHLIAETQVIFKDQDPLPYSIVVSERLKGASDQFVERFDDTNVNFVSTDDLDYHPVSKATVIKKTRTYPVMLQIAQIAQISPTEHEVEAAWNRESELVRKLFKVTGDPAASDLTVAELRVIDSRRKDDDGI